MCVLRPEPRRRSRPAIATFAIAACVLTALVGCGSDDEETAARRTPDVGAEERSITELVGELGDVGCSLDEVDPTEGYDINEQAACEDGSIVLYTFTSRRSQDQVVDGITAIPGEYAVVGELWVAETKSRADAEAVRSALGGNIKS